MDERYLCINDLSQCLPIFISTFSNYVKLPFNYFKACTSLENQIKTNRVFVRWWGLCASFCYLFETYTYILNGMWLDETPRQTSKRLVVKYGWNTCLTYVNYSKFNNQYNERLHMNLKWTWEFSCSQCFDIHMDSKNYKESGFGLGLDGITISS